MTRYPDKAFFRRRGLPKTFHNVNGLLAQGDIPVLDEMAKLLIFDGPLSMRRFYRDVLPGYRNAEEFHNTLGRGNPLGFVQKLAVDYNHTKGYLKTEFDRRYFCLVALTRGNLTVEVIVHEPTHVGFAYDYYKLGVNQFADVGNFEENICYPAGRFADEALTFIKKTGIRET